MKVYKHYINIKKISYHYDVPVDLIRELAEYEIIQVEDCGECQEVEISQIEELERCIRLFKDLSINAAGIHAVCTLHHKVRDLQSEIKQLKRQLKEANL